MISPISFQGTYKVYNRENEGIQDYFELLNKCETSGIKTKMEFSDYAKEPSIPTIDGKEVISTATIVTPDAFDEYIETFCKNAGIKFTRLNETELLNPENVIERTTKPKRSDEKTKIVLVDAQKLDELAKRQTIGNFDHVGKDYKNYFKQDADFSLKSGDEIIAPTLVLSSDMAGGIRGAIEYVENFGAENLNDDSIFIDLIQMTDDPDHCTYFAMKNIGMKKIPVCVDEKTYELGDKMGLFE